MKIRASLPAMLFCLIAMGGYSQQINVSRENRTLAVTATGTASTMADRAAVHVGFVAYGANSAAAYAAGSKASNAITRAVASLGVEKDLIESEQQSLAEMQPYELNALPPEERAARRFAVRQSWTVRTRASDAALVLHQAVEAGANQSGAIDWSVADENELEAKAAAGALAQARAIATGMAAGLGIKLGGLIYASNQAPVAEQPQPVMMRAGVTGGALSAVETRPLAIAARKVERTATVYAVFSVE